MNFKKFEYRNCDLPILKRDLLFRFFFAVFFIGIFAWQLINTLEAYKDSNVSTIMIYVSYIVIITALVYALVSLSYATKTLDIINTIKRKGRCVSSVQIMFSLKKSGFVKLYSKISALFALLLTLVLISTITYSILDYITFSRISFYLPVLILYLFIGYNTVYHLRQEITTIKYIEEVNAL